MLTEIEIEKAIRLGEDSFVEFRNVSQSDYELGREDQRDVAYIIAAFANTAGGHLILGIDDDGNLSGVGTLKQADRIMGQVSHICQDRIRPSLACHIAKVEVRGTPVIVVEVPAFSPQRPHFVDGLCYIRDANRSRQATRDEQIRILQSADYHPDEQPVEGARLENLDSSAIQDFIAAAGDLAPSDADLSRYLQALKCLAPSGQPSVAGILFFGKDPQRWFPDARISAVRFPGSAMSGEFLDRNEIGGRLPDQMDSAIAFLRRHVTAPAAVEGFQRVQKGIPENVLREAVLNSLVHRDYRTTSQIRLFVFDDRVEVINPGVLLNQLSLENIRIGGISQRRNPVICGLANRLRRLENYGLGVPQMIRIMRENGLPEPEFSIEGGHFRVILRRTPAGKES